MTLVLGSLTLNKVRNFRIVKEVTIPRIGILSKSTGTVDSDVYVRQSDMYEIVCELNDSDRKTAEGYLRSIRTVADSASGFSEKLWVEKVESEYIVGRDYSSPECWVTTIGLVISNS